VDTTSAQASGEAGDAQGRRCVNRTRGRPVIFDDWVDNKLAVEIGGVELDTFDPDDDLASFKRVFTGDPAEWFGTYVPTGETVDVQDVGGSQIWLRIEPGG
jgi:hypothetical protein